MSIQLNHPEWEKENSLTAREDRTSSVANPWRPEQGAPKLSDTEVDDALKELNNTAYVQRFPRVDRSYADPPPSNQQIGLISFTPAKGAKPNEGGVYGFAKLRGNFATAIEANQRAEYLIRNVDSYHQIYHTYVGRPFPLSVDPKFVAETEEIDIRKQVSAAVSADVKSKKQKERRDIQDIKEREEALLADSKKAQDGIELDDDPYEKYITLRVKKAQLIWTYLEHQKKMEEVLDILVTTRKEVEELDSEHPTFKDKYFDKYKKARESAGLPVNGAGMEDNFMKYMIEDKEIPAVTDLYNKRYL